MFCHTVLLIAAEVVLAHMVNSRCQIVRSNCTHSDQRLIGYQPIYDVLLTRTLCIRHASSCLHVTLFRASCTKFSASRPDNDTFHSIPYHAIHPLPTSSITQGCGK